MTPIAPAQVWAHRRSATRVRVVTTSDTHAFVRPVLRAGSMAGAGRDRAIPHDRLRELYRLEPHPET